MKTEKMWRVTCINHGIEETTENVKDLNEFFEWSGIDKEEYGEDLFKIELMGEED